MSKTAIAIKRQIFGSTEPGVSSILYRPLLDDLNCLLPNVVISPQVPLEAGAGGFSSWQPLLYPKEEKAKAMLLAFQRFIDLNFSVAVVGSAAHRPN